MVRENDAYHPSCVTAVYFTEKNENTHSVHVITKWRWKGAGVEEEEPTKGHDSSTCT